MYLCGSVTDTLNHRRQILHLIIAGQQSVFYFLRDMTGSLRTSGNLMYTVRNRADMAGQTVYFRRLFSRTLRQSRCTVCNLLRARCYIFGGCVQLSHGLIQFTGDLIQCFLDLFKFAGIFIFQSKTQISRRNLPQSIRDFINIDHIFPKPERNLIKIICQHAKLIAGLIVDGLIQLSFGNPGSRNSQFPDRSSDDSSYLQDHQTDQSQYGQNRHKQHTGCQLLQFHQYFTSGDVGYRCPVASRNIFHLDISVVIEGQSRLSFADLLTGIYIHSILHFTQTLPGNGLVFMSDDGICPCINQKDPACILKLHLTDDSGNGIQIHICRSHTPYSSALVFQHP